MADTMDGAFVNIKHDAARLSARRAIERMIRAELGAQEAAE